MRNSICKEQASRGQDMASVLRVGASSVLDESNPEKPTRWNSDAMVLSTMFLMRP